MGSSGISNRKAAFRRHFPELSSSLLPTATGRLYAYGDAEHCSAQVSQELVKSAVSEHAANFKVPRQVFFVESLARNAMGKVQKNTLSKQYA